MRVLAWPAASEANGNPYVALLYEKVRARGHEVERLSRRALRTRPDVIHIHWPEQLVRTESAGALVSDAVKLLALLILARRRGAVLVWTAHNLQPHERQRRRLMDAFLLAFTGLVDVVIALTDRSRALLGARHPRLRRKPFVVVPHGHYRDVYAAPGGLDKVASRRTLGLDPARRTLLTLGQIRAYKNVPALVRAFVENAPVDAQLAIVGGVVSEELRAQLETARNGDERVRLRLSTVAPQEVARWHAAADVVVLAYDTASSLNSGAALLALSLDRPVVMPDGPSARDLRGQVGVDWVTPLRGSASDFVAAALTVPTPAAARPDLDHLDWGTIADRTLAAYELARDRRGRRRLRAALRSMAPAGLGVRTRLRALRGSRFARRAVSMAMTGRRVECPCCGSRFRRFRGFNGPDRMCWTCDALERHRSLWLYIGGHPELTRPGLAVLHVAPEPMLADRFRSLPGCTYVGGDLTAEFGSERIDVTDLRFEDASFDVVMCNHVLEHVPDDRRAMREIARVLKPDGCALLLVPDVETEITDEDPSLTDPHERESRFGQADHVRRYGWDYVDRLREAGFIVEVDRPERHLPAELTERYRLRKYGEVEPIFACRLPRG